MAHLHWFPHLVEAGKMIAEAIRNIDNALRR
jgi:hypothetical protein